MCCLPHGYRTYLASICIIVIIGYTCALHAVQEPLLMNDTSSDTAGCGSGPVWPGVVGPSFQRAVATDTTAMQT
jgi:hypothetical protein